MSVELAMLRTMLRLSALQTSREIRAAPSDKLGQEKIMELMNFVTLAGFDKVQSLIASMTQSFQESTPPSAECSEAVKATAVQVLGSLSEALAGIAAQYKEIMPE